MQRSDPRLALVAAALVLAASATAATPPAAIGSYAFVDVAVIPMDREQVLLHQTVIVDGGRISALGPIADVSVPASATRVTGGGRYLIPGLVDAHVHLTSTTELQLYLANGVTTIFNLHGQPAHLRWRQQVADGNLLGPTIFSTGPLFDRPHTAAEAVRLVDEQAAAGYDGIKVYNQVSSDEYTALIEAAKRKNMLLMGHVARGPGFEATVAAGQSIAHAEEFTYTFFNPQRDGDNSHIVYDESRIPEAVRLTAAAGVFVTPTLSMYRDIVRQATDLDRYLENPDLDLLAPWVRAGLQPALNRYHNRYSPEAVRRLEVSLAFQRKLVRALAAAGVPLLTGTDATTIGPVGGVSLHEELRELVESGLTPWQALQASTANPARYFRKADIVGTLAVGKRADLVLLSADPLADIENTRQIEGVMVGGRWLDRAALAHLVAEIPGMYARELVTVTAQLGSDPRGASRYLDEHDPMSGLGAAVLTEVVAKEGVTRLQEVLRRLRAEAPRSMLAGEDVVNTLGYQLLGAGRTADAIAVFEANVEDFPRSANALDSLAEAHAKSGDLAGAVEIYSRALVLDPAYANAEFARNFVSEHRKAK
jgi:imidazolonepropionase-like amidohydrolase